MYSIESVKQDGIFAVFEVDNLDVTYFVPFCILTAETAAIMKSDDVYDKLPISVDIVRSGSRVLSFKGLQQCNVEPFADDKAANSKADSE